MPRYLFTVLLAVSLFTGSAEAQEVLKGCTDPAATNYNSSAMMNDGSCLYKTTVYNPPFKYLLPKTVEETSGLVFFDNTLWTINDGGNPPVIYQLKTENGKVEKEYTIANAENSDWEALAQDDNFVFIGDFGNNSGNRNDLRVLKIAKNELVSGADKLNAGFIYFTYPDYPGKVEKKKDNNFDCEAMICMGDSLYLFSKNRGDNKSKLYRLPKQEGRYTADLIDSFNVNGLVTGADYNKETDEVTLVGYTNKTWLPFLWLFYDFEGHNPFSGNKRRIDMLNLPATQTEAITFINGRHGVITSEGHKLFTQTAYDLDTGKWLGGEATEKDTILVTTPEISATPNPIEGKYLFVHLNHLPAGTFEVKMMSQRGKLIGVKTVRAKTDGENLQLKFKTKHLKPGYYNIQVNTTSGIIRLKCVKPKDG